MSKVKFVGCLGLLLATTYVFADEKHPEHDAVVKVVDLFFKAINTSDAKLISEIALHDAMTYSVREQEDGEWKISNSSWTVQKTNCDEHPDGPPEGLDNSEPNTP